MINAEKLCHGDIISALEKGEFYSSTGPEITELYIENGRVFVKCSEAKKVRFLTNNRYGKLISADKESLTEGFFELKENTAWFRVEITDQSGEKAYTNAYFL